MKFVAKESRSNDITQGRIYEGSLVSVVANAPLKIAVFNDDGVWKVYPPSMFIPHNPEYKAPSSPIKAPPENWNKKLECGLTTNQILKLKYFYTKQTNLNAEDL